MSKQALRRILRERRRAVPAREAAEAAARAAEHLAAAPFWRPGARTAIYLPCDGELDTAEIARRARRTTQTVFLPRVAGDGMEFVAWRPGDALVANRFGIGEPPGSGVPCTSLDLVLLPAVGWTRAGLRLGMGGGFYDRCLSGVEGARRPLLVGLAYACQCIDEALAASVGAADSAAIAEPWDVALDAVLTEKGLLTIGDDARLQR